MIHTTTQVTTPKPHRAVTTAAVGLPALRSLFRVLHRRGIRYCHWKSNLRLEAALDGRTDLDLLVDPAQQRPFRQILRDHDVIPILAPSGKRYPWVEDYLGYDVESGRQFHLHVHYQLVLGEQFVKNYRLPLVKPFLASVRQRYGVNAPAPELELIVLSMRALLKYRDRDVVKDLFTIRTPGIPDHILAEIDWLRAQTSLAQVYSTLRDLGNWVPQEVVLGFLNTITVEPRNGRILFHLRQRLRQALRQYQRHPRFWARLIYSRELWRRRNSFLRFKPQRQMTLPHTGLTLALVGVDGAGKTTLAQALTHWLAWKLDAQPYYLGSKQPSPPSRWAYFFFRMARRSHTELTAHIAAESILARHLRAVRDLFLYSHYLFTGFDRYRRCRAGSRRAHAGAIVVYDRFPLQAPLDGPQIHLAARANDTRSAALFSRLEQHLYRRMAQPDLLIVLEVDPELAFRRKPDHARETLVAKNRVLSRVTAALASAGTQPVRIDAGLPLADVLGQLQQAIWRRFRSRHGC